MCAMFRKSFRESFASRSGRGVRVVLRTEVRAARGRGYVFALNKVSQTQRRRNRIPVSQDGNNPSGEG